MSVVKSNLPALCVIVLLSGVIPAFGSDSSDTETTGNVELLKVYPTTLTMGCTESAKARTWSFRPEDIYTLSGFALSVGDDLKVKTEAADLGIGHCKDGVVWAVIIPRTTGTMRTADASKPEDIDHVWLRFHPAEVEKIFPPKTVGKPGNKKLFTRIRQIADRKIRNSWQSNRRALIPGRKDMTVDVDARNRLEYFFGVKRKAVAAKHVFPVKTYSTPAGKSPAAKRRKKKPVFDPPSPRRKVNANQPKVVSVYPPDGAENVEPNTEIRIRFDRPMDPDSMMLLMNGGSFTGKGMTYDKAKNEFTIPVSLEGDCEFHLRLDFGHAMGFRDAKGHAAAPYHWAFCTKESPEKPTGTKPKLLSCLPASGTQMPLLTELCLTFDQPMDLSDLALKEDTGQRPSHLRSRLLKRNIRYDSRKRKAFIPLLFPPNCKGTVQLVHAKNRQGVQADPVELKFSTGKERYGKTWPKRLEERRRLKELTDLLQKMKEARSQLKSLSVATHSWTISPGMIQSGKCVFRMQGDNQFYADADEHMPLYVGCDGKNCWKYYGRKGEETLVFIPQEEVKKNVVICDPFDLTRRGVDEVIENNQLEYLGIEDVDGRECHSIRSWSIRVFGSMAFGNVKTFRIDTQSYRPMSVETDMGDFVLTYRFVYDRIDKPMEISEFRPRPAKGVQPREPEPIKKEYKCDTRALNVMDGSDGKLSVWWGQTGSSGSRYGSGVN